MIKAGVFTAMILFFSLGADGQCAILNRVYPDGSMMYSMAPVKFYWTEAKELYGNVVTDQENFFLALRPVPFPEKAEGKKLKGDLQLTLSNQHIIELSHYDTQYIMNDSIMEMMFLLDKKDIDAAHAFEAESVKLSMGKKEGDRLYVFKLHKTAFQDQLECFLNDGKKD